MTEPLAQLAIIRHGRHSTSNSRSLLPVTGLVRASREQLRRVIAELRCALRHPQGRWHGKAEPEQRRATPCRTESTPRSPERPAHTPSVHGRAAHGRAVGGRAAQRRRAAHGRLTQGRLAVGQPARAQPAHGSRSGRHRLHGEQPVSGRDVLAVTEFRTLWSAQALSSAGDQFAQVAIGFLSTPRPGRHCWPRWPTP